MKRSWLPVIGVTLVLGLLAGLAVLQYHWQRQVSESSRDKMRKRVETDANRFAEDFNREIQAAYFNFQTGPAGLKEAHSNEFNERYDYWRSKTSHPELIKGFYFFENHSDSPTLRFDKDSRTFVRAESLPTEVQTIRGRMLVDKDVRAVHGDLTALVLPIPDEHRSNRVFIRGAEDASAARIPDRVGNLVVLLDRDTIAGRIIPDLLQKYFPEGDYLISVSDGDQTVFGSTTDQDVSVPLFDLSPEKFIMFAGRDTMNNTAEATERGVVINKRVETFSRTEKPVDGLAREARTFNLKVEHNGELPRTRIFTRNGPEGETWKLNVQHQAGSIAAYIDNAFRRNLAIGAGLYLLLGAAIFGIFYSAQRAKTFAQRQVDFVSSVSHELRTPLAVIHSAGENLADGVAADSTQVEKYGRLIKGEGRKLSTMVEQILEFAGANSGKQKYNFGETDIGDVVRDAMAECQPLIESGEFAVETEIQDPLPTVLADPSALSRAVQNLIANSVKYSNGSKWLRVSASNGGGLVKISVEDKGIGISQRDMRHLFEPFYRSREVVDAQIHGNGLGLSLVQQIAAAHSGRVSAASHLGRGSKFTIELPCQNRDR